MSLRKISFAVLLCCAMMAPSRAQESSKNSSQDAEVIQTLVTGTQSSNDFIRDRSFGILAQQKGLSKHLNESELCTLISRALSNSKIDLGDHGFAILDQSELKEEPKEKLLIRAMSSKHDWIIEEVLSRLTNSRDTLLPKLIEKIKSAPTKRHERELRLIEHWGPEAKSAVPTLITHYNAVYESELNEAMDKLKRRLVPKVKPRVLGSPRMDSDGHPREPRKPVSPEELKEQAKRMMRIDYLDIVYALSEIGPAAKPAMSIALLAANEKNNYKKNKEYNMAGILCIERLSGIKSTSVLERQRRRKMDELMKRVGGGKKSLGNFLGGTSSKRSKPLSVREIVAQQMDGEATAKAKTNSVDATDSVNHRVELIFQNHDLLTQTGKLTIEEVRNITPPILFADVDADNDQMITKSELGIFLQSEVDRLEQFRRASSQPSRSRLSGAGSVRNSSRSRGGR